MERETIRAACAKWAAGTGQDGWDELAAQIEADPQAFWEEATALIDGDGISPHRLASIVASAIKAWEPLRAATIDWAASSPAALEVTVTALALPYDAGWVSERPIALYQGTTEAVRQLPYELVRDAVYRVLDRRQAGSSPWDLWTLEIGSGISEVDPEMAWQLITQLIDDAPDDGVIGSLGAGQLEDFCWNTSEAFIERIEERAASNPRCRLALGSVWPGASISPEIYARILTAAGQPVPPDLAERLRRE